MPTNPLHIAMLAAGIALAFIGVLIARSGRRMSTFGLTTPTRVVIGLSLAICGYHLIVWVFPPSLTPLQWNRQFWWVLLAGALGVILLSCAMDAWVMRRRDSAAAIRPERDDHEPIR